MLTSVEDLKDIGRLIDDVQSERSHIAEKLSLVGRFGAENGASTGATEDVDDMVDKAAQEISEARNMMDVARLRHEYGDLTILRELESNFLRETRRIAEEDEQNEAEQMVHELETLQTTPGITQLEKWHARIQSLELLPENAVYRALTEKFGALVQEKSATQQQLFEKLALDVRWDSSHFQNDVDDVQNLNEMASILFRLDILAGHTPESDELWSFSSMAKSFHLKFIYLFNNQVQEQPQSIQTYFAFLDRYLAHNLFKCIDIFSNPEIGLTPEMVLRNLINHILHPIRQKVKSTLMKTAEQDAGESLKTLIVLISQIFINDNSLLKKHYYDGPGLVSMIPSDVMDTWLTFEVRSATSQVEKMKQLPLSKSCTDFQILLENLLKYFEPFFDLEYPPFMEHKLKVTNRIFMGLPGSLCDHILNYSGDNMISFENEAQFKQTVEKLQYLRKVENILNKYQNMLPFVNQTVYLNEQTNSSYPTVFSDVLKRFSKAIITVRESIVHRLKKLISANLRVYFKINEWARLTVATDQPMAELLGTVRSLQDLFNYMTLHESVRDVIFCVQNEALKIIIHFMDDYVVNLNKFSQCGLEQLQTDYSALRETLNMNPEQSPYNTEEAAFLEKLRILELKHIGSEDSSKFLSKAYIEGQSYAELRTSLEIWHLPDSQIANSLYRAL
ncbi:LAMI_0E02828g1_1 [Lachancea mirantina]|uniref:LAMI_0E02828g1_1 n=1 Tax=Lachancea mirantina TaxID=1230905 RepID=A0A1G4JJE5_9SACH|nr:LAMI_0E02828g1_1 [Lachancea mirantina]